MSGPSPPLAGAAPRPMPARTGSTIRHGWSKLTRAPVMSLARQAAFLAILLVAWITLKPFPDLSGFGAGDIVTGQEGLTYALFGLLALAAFALVVPEHRTALASCLTPGFLALAAWIAASILWSIDPSTSAKRLSLTVAVVVAAACLPLLARTRDDLRRLLAVASLSLLGLCYLGMILVPDLAIHQPTDTQEPALAGAWRGVFGHKNAAAAVIAMVLFIGVAVFRAGAPVAGAAVVVLASAFLIGSEGKSAIGLTMVVFAITGLFVLVRSLAGRAVLALGAVLLINALTVGTVVSGVLASLVARLPVDTTFTGRAGLWRFAVDSAGERLLIGHGFFAFWRTEATQGLAEGSGDWETSWAGTASHSHNGYLDIVLGLGLVGLALALVVLVLKPLRDFHRATLDEGAASPFAMMFVQIWLFGLLLSAMESFFFDRADSIWVTFLFAVFGLHYLARFRTR